MIHMTERPSLREPMMLAAFRGWNDGGEAASTAIEYLRDVWSARKFAAVDPEDFFDFQVTRPIVSMIDGTSRRIEWPSTDIYQASAGGQDVVLVLGHEPNLRWKAFCEDLLGLARELGVVRVVTFGAFLADVPHTTSVPIAGAASDPGMLDRLDAVPSRYEGPTGITGVLHSAAAERGFTSATLWAAVPHYIPSGPNPAAARALIERLISMTGMDIPLDELSEAESAWMQQIEDLIESNPELSSYIDRLEEYTGRPSITGPVPSGEELAAELEKFLREQPGDEGH